MHALALPHPLPPVHSLKHTGHGQLASMTLQDGHGLRQAVLLMGSSVCCIKMRIHISFFTITRIAYIQDFISNKDPVTPGGMVVQKVPTF